MELMMKLKAACVSLAPAVQLALEPPRFRNKWSLDQVGKSNGVERTAVSYSS